jgi:rubrerythrin
LATNPFEGVEVPRKITEQELAHAIRLDVEAELDAINTYHSHILATDDTEAKKVLSHIAGEEKQHAAEFLELLKRLDPEQAKELEGSAINYRQVQAAPMTVTGFSNRGELLTFTAIAAFALGIFLYCRK